MTQRKGPLAGVRILEIGHFIAAPFAARVLADLGADILKIEPPGGDPVRTWGAAVDGHSVWWSQHGRNKRSICLNLKAPEGVAIVKRLVADCDALVENLRPGQLAKLGLGDDVLRAVRPDLVIAHVSGYGMSGPARDRAAFGVIGEAVGGLRYLTDHPPGKSDLPPVRTGVSIGDSIAGLYAALGIVSALLGRTRGNDGLTLDVALADAVLSLMEGMLPEYGRLGTVRRPTGSTIPTAAPSNAYPTKEGRWILIGGNSNNLFAKLCALIGRPELAQDPRFLDNRLRVQNMDELDEIIAGWTRRHTAGEALARLEEADIPSSSVYSVEDCVADPQFRYRGMVRDVDDPLIGPTLHAGIVPEVVEAPGEVAWTGPAVGAHTDEVLAAAGIDAAERERLRAAGVIG
ncbi:CaiB/BaiF CoA transferase family protein [Acuticoccus mangrovi]|uniref:CoA transferase n=1 Tax=Acuticoccus mangrovi TaxID=2796142 RepID=A0A934IKW5_9HYPH|nr:CoA transferase [Acuticoccus mangrovi]MBJ3774172.1 CoA transferase [Acuticoccus mangrovi]